VTLSIFRNEESRRDSWLLLAAGVLLCIETLLLLYQLRLIQIPGTRAGSSSQERRIGEVTLKEKTVTTRAPSSLSWYPLAGGDSIHLNDTVMTGSGAKARIALDGASELLLESDTLIRFSETGKTGGSGAVVSLEVNQGTLRVKSEKAPVRVALRSREIQVDADSEIVLEKTATQGESRLEVARGNAVVTDSARERAAPVTMREGDSLSLPEAAGPVAPPVPRVVRLLRRPRPGPESSRRRSWQRFACNGTEKRATSSSGTPTPSSAHQKASKPRETYG
jgi:hypothetical protein